ncbi:PREDICTED: uncharacterized protein LOC104602367 [Nelumbo nucifera]|uniref:Uncharacterized protein LOC104602367 n=1 Tax=Nelumbo nucifera TaxID=4432 RepID=A0A1U8AFC9_NELNU|nr:PREDICTED: uncharacterized protein LOC104602367 [Nelumbo nucifera]
MVDLQTVCCMCGDVGFSDKLFRCTRCQYRFQHSYCSNYYSELSETPELCDWCQSEERSAKHRGSNSKKFAGNDSSGAPNRSQYSGDKIKQHDRDDSSDKGRGTGSNPSPRPTTRRYKLLKDVMC